MGSGHAEEEEEESTNQQEVQSHEEQEELERPGWKGKGKAVETATMMEDDSDEVSPSGKRSLVVDSDDETVPTKRRTAGFSDSNRYSYAPRAPDIGTSKSNVAWGTAAATPVVKTTVPSKSKGKGKVTATVAKSFVPLYLSELDATDPLRLLFGDDVAALEAKCKVLLSRQHAAQEAIGRNTSLAVPRETRAKLTRDFYPWSTLDAKLAQSAKVGKGNATGKKGKARKKQRNQRVKRQNAARVNLRQQQAAAFERGRSEFWRMLRQHADLLVASLANDALDDSLVVRLAEILSCASHGNFVAKSHTGLLWVLSAFPPRATAGVAETLLASPKAIDLLGQLASGDPRWKQTLEALPTVAENTPNLLTYLLPSKPCDEDGPLPLADTTTAEKVGIVVDPDQPQLYGGSATSGASHVNEELQLKGVTKMGKVLEATESGTAKTGGGRRVFGEHLSQTHRLTIKFSQNGKPFIKSSNSYKARYGVPDDSREALAEALDEGKLRLAANGDRKYEVNPTADPPRIFAYLDNAPTFVSVLMESLLIVGGRLAAGSTLFDEAASDLGIDIPSNRGFQSRNREIGVEDRTSSWFDPDSQRARGTASLLKQWETARPRMIARCVKGGKASAARTNEIVRDKNLVAWIKGYKHFLHYTGIGYGQRKPALRLRAIEGHHEGHLASGNPELDEILTPYPRSITDGRGGQSRTAEEEERAKALIADHVPSRNKFVPLFPPDRRSMDPTAYPYQYRFTLYGKKAKYKLVFTREDLVAHSSRARKWFTKEGCDHLADLAEKLNVRLRRAEEEGMNKTVEKLMGGAEFVYNENEEDDEDEDEDEEDDDEDDDDDDDDDEEDDEEDDDDDNDYQQAEEEDGDVEMEGTA
ncbi:hypothetical protein JCM11491_004603 [Sporobolomyces phaffii]